VAFEVKERYDSFGADAHQLALVLASHFSYNN